MSARYAADRGDAAALHPKLKALSSLLNTFGSVAIGFSGGVDSTFLAAACQRIMPERTLLVHLSTPLVGTPERRSFEDVTSAAAVPHEEARCVGDEDGLLHLPVLDLALDPLADADIVRNDARRCYHCKLAGFARIIREARRRGYAQVIDGSNADDADDVRPGMQAISELGVRSPLMETGWHKSEERELLRVWHYPVWNLPAGACLATRIATGEPLEPDKISQIRACEDLLLAYGLRQVRARLSAGTMRIEAAAADLRRLSSGREDVADDDTRRGGETAADGVELPEQLLRELRDLVSVHLDRRAHPYRKGDMNAL